MKTPIPLRWRIFAVEYLGNPDDPGAAFHKAHPDVPMEQAMGAARRLLASPQFRRILGKERARILRLYRIPYEDWVMDCLDYCKNQPTDADSGVNLQMLERVGKDRGFLPVDVSFTDNGNPPIPRHPLHFESPKTNTKTKGEFMDNLNQSASASCATHGAKPGRKKKMTPERCKIILDAIARGASEKAARIKAGVCGAVFYRAKKEDAVFRQTIEEAQRQWNDIRYQWHVKTVESAKYQRGGHKKIKRPEATKHAKLIAWHLISQVPLNIASISIEQEQEAAQKFGLPWEFWCRQRDIFGLMGKVYARRAKLRGEEAVPSRAVTFIEDEPTERWVGPTVRGW